MTAGDRACQADQGRAAVAEAEETAFGGTEVDIEVPWTELVVHAGRVTGGAWWATAVAIRVEVRTARVDAVSSSASLGKGVATMVVRISPGQCTLATLAHELAHVVAGVGDGHGPRFRRAHVDVVTLVAGARPAGHLYAAYRQFGLPIADRDWPRPSVGAGLGFVWGSAP